MSLFIILLRHNCHLLTSNRFELLYNLCYSKFLLIDFVASLHHQPLISCGAKCYFPKLGYQLFSVQYFSKKLKTINFQFFPHSWSLKCRTFLRMACWDFWINALLASFLISLFFYITETLGQKCNISRTKRAFKLQ